MEWAEQIGLGELGLTPDQFWTLTPHEFWVKFEGFMRAENRRMWLVGLHGLLTQQYKSKPKTPDAVLGYGRPMKRYPEKSWLKRDR